MKPQRAASKEPLPGYAAPAGPPWLVEEYYTFIEECLRNGVNGWGATSTERWFVARLEAEASYLGQVLGLQLRFPQILAGEYRKGLPQLTGQDWEDYQAALRAGREARHEWARKRARQPAP